MSHYLFEAETVMAHQILEMTHYILLYRANDSFALFSKMNPAQVYSDVPDSAPLFHVYACKLDEPWQTLYCRFMSSQP